MRSLCCPQTRTQFINLCPQSRTSSNEDSGVIRRTTNFDWITIIQQSKISQMANYRSCSTLYLSWNLWPLIKNHALPLPGWSLGSFPGVILPKIDKNHTFLPCYPKRSPPIDVLTLLNDFRHKTGIIKTNFSCLLIHIAITRGSLGSFPGVILLKIDENHTFLTCYAKRSPQLMF